MAMFNCYVKLLEGNHAVNHLTECLKWKVASWGMRIIHKEGLEVETSHFCAGSQFSLIYNYIYILYVYMYIVNIIYIVITIYTYTY